MDSRLRMYLAELLGTYLVVVLGAGALCSSYLPAADSRYYSVGGVTLAVALADGLALAVVVSATCAVSPGCCNPAITLSLFVNRRLELARTLLLVGVQLLGSFLAGLTLRGLYSADLLVDARMGAPHLRGLLGPGDEVTLGGLAAGVGVEFLLAAFLAVAAYATLLDRPPQERPRPGLPALGLGLAKVVVVLFGFHLTGGAANPARWFGPAVWELSLAMPGVRRPLGDHPVYWVGPVFGALAGTVAYGVLLGRTARE
jgi:aquaporin Z